MKSYLYTGLFLRPNFTALAIVIPLAIAFYVWRVLPEPDFVPGDPEEGPHFDIFTVILETLHRLFDLAREYSYPGLVRTIPGALIDINHPCHLAGMGIAISALIQAGVIDMPTVLGYVDYVATTLEPLSQTIDPRDYSLVSRLFYDMVAILLEIRRIIGDDTTIIQSPDNYEIFQEIRPLIEELVKKFFMLRIAMEHPWDVLNALTNTFLNTLPHLPKDMYSLTLFVKDLRDFLVE